MRRTRVDGGRADPRRGSALLTVLWFTVALTAVAFALSRGVRAEFDRASLHVDTLRAYYLARGAVEAAMQRIASATRTVRPAVDGQEEQPPFEIGQRFMRFNFSSGSAVVEIIGESGKLDVNSATPEALARLMAASGVDPRLAVQIAAGVAEYRKLIRDREIVYGMKAAEALERFGNLEEASTFRPVDASIQELEELLTIPGVTPELLYGSFVEQQDGSLRQLPGLARNLTTRGGSSVEVNYASPELLAAAGLPGDLIERIERLRGVKPLRLADFGGDAVRDPFADYARDIRLTVGSGSDAYTLRATAELADAGGSAAFVRARRTVVARVERGQADGPDAIRISRWYDTPY